MLTLDQLKAQSRWLLWQYVQRPGAAKPTKIPCQPDGSAAKSNDPATWRSYADSMAAVSRFSGVGVVTGNGVTSVDLDGVIADGKIIPEALAIVTALNSYTEVSPSGSGLLVLASGVLLGPGIGFTSAGFTGEIRDVGFFHTFTGKHLDGTPSALMPRQAEIETLYDKFRAKYSPRYNGSETPDPAAVDHTIRKIAEWLDRLGVTLLEIVPLGDGRTLLRLSHCPLFPSHRASSAGIGVSVSGRPQNMCKHNGCGMAWSQWCAAVEKQTGVRLQLGRKLIFKSGAK